MMKLVYMITRKEGMSFEAFQTHWREIHAPIAARIPGIRRYVQCHTLPETYGGKHPPAYDGVAELWYDDMEAFRESVPTPECDAAREDELKFIDHSRSILIFTEEKPVVE